MLSKSYLSYRAIMTAIFETSDVSITDDDEVIKLRPIDTYNHSSIKRMRYTFTDGVWKCNAEVHEENDSEVGQTINKYQRRHLAQPT